MPVLEAHQLERAGGRRRLADEPHHLLSCVVEDPRGRVTARMPVPDGAVRPHLRPVHLTVGMLDPGEHARSRSRTGGAGTGRRGAARASRALASGHQSAIETSPSRPVAISVHSPVTGSQTAGCGIPPRSWTTARRRSPAIGDHAADASCLPSSTRSATVPPVRGSITRNASCISSPNSACCRQRSEPSAERPPRLYPPARPATRMWSVDRATSLAVAPPSSLTCTAKPSSPLIETASIPGTHAIPSFHPGSSEGNSGRDVSAFERLRVPPA